MRFLASNVPSSWMIRTVVTLAAASSVLGSVAQAQFFPGGRFGLVGGVRIDTDGVLRNATEEEQNGFLAQMRDQVAGAQGDLAQPADLRMISLKKIQQLVLESNSNQTPLPEEVLYLGGLTRVEYVFVYPERQDIVIAGPAEPWKVGPAGSIVGKVSGRPIVYLDDLLTAFRYVSNARNGGVSVSIEPTEQGVRQLNQLLRNVGANPNPQVLGPMVAEAFGPQQIKLSGVPTDSHMARVLLTADYRMKLYGMNLAKAPVDGLPSYLEMIKGRSSAAASLQSRWWMACDYNSVAHSRDRNAWKISGPGIKTLTEQEVYDASGTAKQTGKVDALAKKWADLFTKKMDVLATRDPVFGDLRNVMDLCVVAALIEAQNLQSQAGCDLSAILGDRAVVETTKFQAPTSLDPQVSFLQSVQGLLVAASGGVMIESWAIATKTEVSDELAAVRDQGNAWSEGDRWYQ
ncbi:MAG: DUF1598 domain-containing protein [Pirellula sp.]